MKQSKTVEQNPLLGQKPQNLPKLEGPIPVWGVISGGKEQSWLVDASHDPSALHHFRHKKGNQQILIELINR